VLLWILLSALLLPASARADAGGAGPECKDELPLAQAAGELLLRGGGPPSSDALTAAVRAAGSDVVGVHAFYWREEPASAATAWLAQLKQSADAPLVCGLAHGEGGHLLLAAARAGSLEPLSARSAYVRGELATSFHDAELVVADGHGELQRLPVGRAQLARGIAIDPELTRPAQVQLLARGPAGPRPIAERVLPMPAGSSEAASTPVSTDDEAAQPEVPLEQLLQGLRLHAGRAALRDNVLLRKVAATHAKRVCADGRVAHELTPGANPERRLLEAGVSARRVGETVARAQTPAAAFASFERSLSHRLTLLEAGFTDVGIGQATDASNRTCVVILLAAWPRFTGR
jgi:uncharacterized protein YkwD